MIELLTVIAIIAILAGIIFPVGARVRANAYKSADMSSMNDIRNALQLYKADQEAYPPQLLGYASLYFGGPNDGQVVPADQARGFLYPKREPLSGLQPANDRVGFKDITTAVWPQKDPTPCPETDTTTLDGTGRHKPCVLGSAAGAQIDLDGNGKIDDYDDIPGARQANSLTTVTRTLSGSDYLAERNVFGRDENIGGATADGSGNYVFNAQFYSISGYDVAKVKSSSGDRVELRYAPFWTVYGLAGGSKDDDPRQLGYAEPPDNTVITWNSFWRDYDQNGVPQHGKQEVVLFLGGGAKTADSQTVSSVSWRTRP